MNYRKTFAVIGSLFLGAVTLCAAPKKSPYDANWNQKRIEDISKEILRQVKVQEDEYQKAYEEFQKQKSGNGQAGYGDWRDNGHGMDPRMPSEGDAAPKQEEFPPYKLDVQKLKDAITLKFGGKEEDTIGPRPRVDLRSKMDIQEFAEKEVRKRPEFRDYQPEAIFQLIRDVDKKYPLLHEGQSVKVMIDGKEYEGIFKTNGPHEITIGGNKFKKGKLAKEVLALFDERENASLRKIELSKNPVLAQEIKDLEQKYPLYKEGQKVEISFAHGNEPRRIYKGAFKLYPPFKLSIGKDMLNKNDLPEIYRARFYPEVNTQCRMEEFNKHLVLNKLKMEMEEAIAEEVKEIRRKQFEQNLPKGWVFLNETWKMPSELVEDTLEYRKEDMKLRQGVRRRDSTGGVSIMPGASN